MAQPMEHTDIGNPIASFKQLHNDDRTFDKKVLQHEKEEMDVVFLHESCDKEMERHRSEQELSNKLHGTQSFEKAFPWLVTFDKVMHSSIGKKKFHLLERLLNIYVNNISKSVESNYIMTYEIIKLKKHLNNTLTFFHFYWHDIKEHMSDHNSYLNKISILLAIYIDTELRTSKRNKDPSKVAAKLFSALWIYLNKSEEHIFKVLLRIKLITKRYAKICNPIFTKSFANLKTNWESMTGIKYVRYLLLLKLWRNIKDDAEGERYVDELSIQILGSHMPKMHVNLLKLLPKPPLNCENETLWLMQPNLFDLKQSRNDFLMCEKSIEMTNDAELSSIIKNTETCHYNNLAINLNTIEDKEIHSMYHTSNKNQKIDFSENRLFQEIYKKNNYLIRSSDKDKINKIKKSKFVPNMKTGEIVVIDFSKEEEECISSTARKKNKCKKNLGWLRIVAKRCKAQKNIKYEKQTEITDVHSTDNSVDLKHMQQCFDKKDNKNTKNISFFKKELSLSDVWFINPKEECDVNKSCDHCISLLRSKEKQFSNILHLLIALKLIGQNTKDPVNLLNILKEYKDKNLMSSQNISLDEKDSSIITLLSKISENGLTKSQFNEMLLQTHYNTPKNTSSCKNEGINGCKENYLLDNIISGKDYNLKDTEITRQNLSPTINTNSNCFDKIGVNSYNNSDCFNINKLKETTMPDKIYNNGTETKPIFDKKIVSILSDLERCMHVLGRISKHFMNVHIKKSDTECLSEKTDFCADSATLIQDQAAELSLNHCISQNLNALNTTELHQILKLYDQKSEMKNCNNLYSQDMCISTTNRYDYGEKKNENKMSTDLNTFAFNKNQQSTKCKLLQNIDNDVIKEEIKTKQDSYDNIRNPECFLEQLQKIDNNQTFTLNVKKQMDTCTFELQETESFANDEKGYLSILKDYSQPTVEDNLIKIDFMANYDNVGILDSILDTAANRNFLDDVKNIDIKEDTDVDLINKQIMLEDSQSSLISLIDQDSFCNVLNSSEEIVNPYLMKTSIEEKMLCISKSTSEINAEWYSQESLTNITDTSVIKKSEQCDNQKNSFGRCVDIVAFGLNAKEEDFDLFALDDNGSISMLKSMSSTCSSPLLIQSDVKISESREFSSKYASNDLKAEQVYDFHEGDTLKEDGLRTDTTNQALINEMCTSRDVPSNVLINYFPIQTEDLHTSPYNCTSVYPLQLDLESLPTEQLIEAPNLLPALIQHDLTSCNSMPLDSESIFTENDNLSTQQFTNGLQSIEPYELMQQNIKITSDNNQLYANQKETCQLPLSSHVSMEKGRLSKVIENSNNLWTQVELSELNDSLPQKKRILMNFQGKPIPSIIFKNGMENDHSVIMITDGVSRDTNLLYKVESKGNILISTEKLCLKPSKQNIARSDTQISKVSAVKEKPMEEISTKISIRPNIRRLDIPSFKGEASVKRRKVTSKLLPLLDTGRLMYSTNTQVKGKDLLSGIKDFSSTSNTSQTII